MFLNVQACFDRRQSCRAIFGVAALCLLTVVAGLSGCARDGIPRKVAANSPPDPVDLQAKHLEVARQLSAQAPASKSREYLVGPLDVLDIKVVGVTKYETTARVDGDGTIRFPDLGLLDVGGMNERKIEDLIFAQLREKGLVNDPQVLVYVKELHAREVTIAGEVKNPGVYSLRGGEALIDLISKAGGLIPTAGNVAYVLRDNTPVTDGKSGPGLIPASIGNTALVQSDPNKMLTPGNGENIQVDLVGLLMRGEKLWNIALKPGDRVTIPALGWVHVTGSGVQKPGTYQLRMTSNMLRQVIDDAGGLKYVASDTLRILRKDENEKQQTYTINYKKIMDEPVSDIAVHGGDTVVVGSNPTRYLVYAVGRAIATIVRVDMIGILPITNGA